MGVGEPASTDTTSYTYKGQLMNKLISITTLRVEPDDSNNYMDD